MSEADTDKFEVQADEETTLTRDSMVEHADHGPMHVDRITVGPYEKRVQFQAELSNAGLRLTEEEIQEQWGETIAADPLELHEPGTMTLESEAVSVDGIDAEMSLSTSGPQEYSEAVHMHVVDQISRGLQAVRDGKPPSECEGADFEIDWEQALDAMEGDD